MKNSTWFLETIICLSLLVFGCKSGNDETENTEKIKPDEYYKEKIALALTAAQYVERRSYWLENAIKSIKYSSSAKRGLDYELDDMLNTKDHLTVHKKNDNLFAEFDIYGIAPEYRSTSRADGIYVLAISKDWKVYYLKNYKKNELKLLIENEIAQIKDQKEADYVFKMHGWVHGDWYDMIDSLNINKYRYIINTLTPPQKTIEKNAYIYRYYYYVGSKKERGIIDFYKMTVTLTKDCKYSEKEEFIKSIEGYY